jgi:hypothetical protein
MELPATLRVSIFPGIFVVLFLHIVGYLFVRTATSSSRCSVDAVGCRIEAALIVMAARYWRSLGKDLVVLAMGLVQSEVRSPM